MNDRSYRQNLAPTVIVCALAAGVVMQVHWRWSEELALTHAQIQTINLSPTDAAAHPQLSVSAESLQARFERLESLHTTDDPAIVYDALVDEAARLGLVLDQITPTSEMRSLDEGVSARAFSVTLSGTYDAVCAYVDAIHTQPVILRVSDLRLAPAGSEQAPATAARLTIQHITIERPASLSAALLTEVFSHD